MTSKPRLLGGTALAAFAGTMLLAASAFAQDQSMSNAAPTPGSPSQPSTAEPGTTAQPMGQKDQNAPSAATPSGQQQTTTPSSSSSSAAQTMSASAGEPLSKVKDAKTKLASASVQDSTGQAVGQVTTIHTTKKGTPTTIDVSLQGSGGQAKTIAIKASELRYDESSNALKTNLTASELSSMPAATTTTQSP